MFSLMRIGNSSTKRRKIEVKIKRQSTFFKPYNLEILKKILAYNKIILDKFAKIYYETKGTFLWLD